MPARPTDRFALAAVALAVAACVGPTAGAGAGTLSRGGVPEGPVPFAWRSEDGGQTGTMAATLPDGRRFEGPFLQVTRDVDRARLAPLWVGWDPYWRGWRPRGYGALPVVEHGVQYTGRVLANLAGPDGERMRCRIQLAHPGSGIGQGGIGVCQLRGGGTVDVNL